MKKVETETKASDIEDEVSGRPQKRKPPETPQKIMQGSEYEIQSQAKKSFSTLFLETLQRKNESRWVMEKLSFETFFFHILWTTVSKDSECYF